jgi:hypothetical protein
VVELPEEPMVSPAWGQWPIAAKAKQVHLLTRNQGEVEGVTNLVNSKTVTWPKEDVRCLGR